MKYRSDIQGNISCLEDEKFYTPLNALIMKL